MYFQPFSAETIPIGEEGCPFVSKVTAREAGRMPSWLLPSTQTLETVREVVVGVGVLVMATEPSGALW